MMDTARSQEAVLSLVYDGTLELEVDGNPEFCGLVVCEDTFIVIDKKEWNLQLYSQFDGKLLGKSHRLESCPMGVCLINNTNVAVILLDSKIEIISFKCMDDVKRIKSLDVWTGLESCDAVAKVKSTDKLVISGRKTGMMCWCVVSLTDGHVDSINQICEGDLCGSHLVIKNETVYISCWTVDDGDTGVYAFDIFNHHKQKFLYQHSELDLPQGLTVDARGFIFVCNYYSNCIHQLTERGKLVTIHKVSSWRPIDIFYEDQDGGLYITGELSNKITRLDYSGIPTEILNMDDRSIQLFEEALKDGKETVHSIRIMVVGYLGVGKTTLVKRLLGEEVNISERRSTEGIDVYVNCCDVSLTTREWSRRRKDSEQDYKLRRLVKFLNDNYQTRDRDANQEQLSSSLQNEETVNNNLIPAVDLDKSVDEPNHHHTQQKPGDKISSTAVKKSFIQSEKNTMPESYIGGNTTIAVQEDNSPSTVAKDNFSQSEGESMPGSDLRVNSTRAAQEDKSLYTVANGTVPQSEANSMPLSDLGAYTTKAVQQDEPPSHVDKGNCTQSGANSLSRVEHGDNTATGCVQEESLSNVFQKTLIQSATSTVPGSEHGKTIATVSVHKESSSRVVERKRMLCETNTIAGSNLQENIATDSRKTDTLREMLKLLQQNPRKAKQDVSKYARLTIWDFAGQYAYYTTHQMFLTKRAIYLLVSDVSRDVSALVEDDCYFDSEGIMKCKVRDLVEIWMNSIHSCAPPDKENMKTADTHTSSYKVTPPPVILVGTHIDRIIQNIHRPVDNYGGRYFMSGLGGNNTASRNPIQYGVQTQRNQMRRVGNFEGHIVSPVFPVVNSLAPRNLIKNDVQNQRAYCRKLGQRYLEKIRYYLRDKPTVVHLVDEEFAIDNTVLDSKLEELKRKIVDVASQQSYWGEQIPTRWFLLEQQLMRLRDAGVKVISRSAVEDLNKKGTVQIKDSEELDLFLKYLHETGTIIYFSIEVLRENIVLDPTWMIDALKSLINASPNLPSYPADNSAQSVDPDGSNADKAVTRKWLEFKEKGLLTLELVDAVWTKEKYPEHSDHKEHVLMIMEQLNIIAKPRAFTEIGEKVEDYFLTPCMLRHESPREFICPEQDIRLVSTPVLCCVFRGRYLPPPIFHRLIAACITRWPVSKKKETSEHLIFCGCCIFDLDLFHRLTLHCRNHIVFARITRLVIDEVKTPEAKLCTRVRKFITLNLSKITSYLGRNLQYELCVQCPPSHGVSEDGTVCLSPPLDTWFADEGNDLDAPITHEHMNNARLYVALVTVCGNALRDILRTYFPVPYKDIYQAILANRAKLIGCRGRRLLVHDQNLLVFPEPLRDKVGTLDQFDLSLLYTLIRNVSTVPAPKTGWDLDPYDQPRDTSLGASVERIRSYRNRISGHTADGRVSRQNLENYWNKFEAVIHDIEAVIGGQAHSQQLERQRRQVISIYEAC
ncbi:hypothetical protein CHS0354_006056 [Potamilus streckersoni]|uniref:Uncharacterized protein n=1 Tax=Potamilus streckersoni TaxID=2493646 RepID=A0AAE0S2W7_9BIVA|nr:hypothetical protein CHS0354_006056 [Potamilus streckersoni]